MLGLKLGLMISSNQIAQQKTKTKIVMSALSAWLLVRQRGNLGDSANRERYGEDPKRDAVERVFYLRKFEKISFLSFIYNPAMCL
jgi:hypothetical protein